MVRNWAPARMETTLYEDSFHNGYSLNVNQMKRNLTLDLNPSRTPMRRTRFSAQQQPVLSSPDLNMLKLASPELERMIISNSNGSVATPTPGQFIFPKVATEAQEQYVRPFVEALNELHNSDSSQGVHQVELPASSSSSSGSSTSGGLSYTNLDHGGGGGAAFEPYHLEHGHPHPHPHSQAQPGQQAVLVKEEPQTVPSLGSTPPLSPIDMECQERIKLERKRQRNRVAASKCRRRKLERISKLEDKVKVLKGENSELSSIVNQLKEHVCHLKEQVMDHVHAGCQLIISTKF